MILKSQLNSFSHFSLQVLLTPECTKNKYVCVFRSFLQIIFIFGFLVILLQFGLFAAIWFQTKKCCYLQTHNKILLSVRITLQSEE